jgi:hypothetical protein
MSMRIIVEALGLVTWWGMARPFRRSTHHAPTEPETNVGSPGNNVP